MKQLANFKVLSRSAAIIASVVILASGVTYAVLQSQQNTLTGNTISTATANLMLSTDGQSFTNEQPGFNFANLIPGGNPVPTDGYSVFLRNTGAAPLTLRIAVSSVPTNPNQINLGLVNIILTPVAGGSSQSFTLQQLIYANTGNGVPINSPLELGAGNTQQYKVKVAMDITATDSQSATLGNIDFAFYGQALTH